MDDPRTKDTSSGSSRDAAIPEASWVTEIRLGNQRAFDAMFDAHYEGLCEFAARIVNSDAVAEEIVQDTFLQIWAHRERWQVATSVPAFLYRAVRNRAISVIRHEAVERRLQDRIGTRIPALGERPVMPDEAFQEGELGVAIGRALDGLSPRCREAFLLRRRHGLSYAEIAETMGVSSKTVEVQIGTALRSLREALRDWVE